MTDDNQDKQEVNITLHDLLEEMDKRYEQHFKLLKTLIGEVDKRYQERFAAQEIATDKATSALDTRLEKMNEIRQQLGDQAATFLPRVEAEQRFEALSEKLESAIESATVATNAHFNANAERLGKIETWQAERAGYLGLDEKRTNSKLQVAAIIIGGLAAMGTVAEAAYLMMCH